MLALSIILFLVTSFGISKSKLLNRKSVTMKQNSTYEIKDEEIYGVSIAMAGIYTITLGICGGLVFYNGLIASAFFRRNGISAVLIALSLVILFVGHKNLRAIKMIPTYEQAKWNFYTALTLFVMVLGSIAVCLQ